MVDSVTVTSELIGGGIDVVVVSVGEGDHDIVGGGGSGCGLLLSGELHLGPDGGGDLGMVGLH